MASCAKQYVGDDEKADQFILECSEQCHNKTAKELWGEKLVLAIKEYANRSLEKTLA